MSIRIEKLGGDAPWPLDHTESSTMRCIAYLTWVTEAQGREALELIRPYCALHLMTIVEESHTVQKRHII